MSSPIPEEPASLPPPTLLQRMNPIAFSLLTLMGVFFLYQVVAGVLTLVLAHGRITQENVVLIRWGTLVGQIACILVPTLVLTRLRHGSVRHFLKIDVPDYRHIILTVASVFALQQVLQGYMMLQDAIPLPPVVKHYVDIFKSMFDETYRMLVEANSPMEFLGVVITVALVPAISEEMLFRGLVQGNLERVGGGFRAAMVTGLIFGMYHLNPFSLVPLVVLGMYFGFIVYRSGNIMVAVSTHFFNNFVACVAIYLQLNEDFVALSPTPSPSTGMIIVNVLFFLFVFSACTYYFIKITETETPGGL